MYLIIIIVGILYILDIFILNFVQNFFHWAIASYCWYFHHLLYIEKIVFGDIFMDSVFPWHEMLVGIKDHFIAEFGLVLTVFVDLVLRQINFLAVSVHFVTIYIICYHHTIFIIVIIKILSNR